MIAASIGIGMTLNPERSWAGTCAGDMRKKNVAAVAPAAAFGSIGYDNSIDKIYVEIAKHAE